MHYPYHVCNERQRLVWRAESQDRSCTDPLSSQEWTKPWIQTHMTEEGVRESTSKISKQHTKTLLYFNWYFALKWFLFTFITVLQVLTSSPPHISVWVEEAPLENKGCKGRSSSIHGLQCQLRLKEQLNKWAIPVIGIHPPQRSSN